ncbi:MAG: hypothetical protein K1X64_10465 [Myxococcaceae bacterium]|nr:hypothetical protein [Myxococcaceae bacterium]
MRALWFCSFFVLGCFIAPREVEVGTAQITVERAKPPQVHWLIDNSWSMLLPIDVSDPRCPVGCGAETMCPPACLTRKAAFNEIFEGLMKAYGGEARHAVTVFPSRGGVCEAGAAGDLIHASTEIDDEAALAASASAAALAVRALVPQGGTPTSSALDGLRQHGRVAASSDRAALVVLVTDGLPNCNAQNPVSCDTPALCRCTLASCGGAFCVTGCLDASTTLTAITDLRAASGADVLVVGLGPDFLGGDGVDMLNAMAGAGGLPRTCLAVTSGCQARYESVPNLANMTQLSARLGTLLKSYGPCRLIAPDFVTASSDFDLRVNGQLTKEWRVERPGLVVLTGVTCETVAADADATLELRPKVRPL